MRVKNIKKGKWYMMDHYELTCYIKCKVVDICGDVIIVKFYNCGLLRRRHAVKANKLIRECNAPSLFSNY